MKNFKPTIIINYKNGVPQMVSREELKELLLDAVGIKYTDTNRMRFEQKVRELQEMMQNKIN